MVQACMSESLKILPARFFRTDAGSEPVREWLKSFTREDRGIVGDDIRTVEFGWPLGMPLCRAISGHKGLWEVRSKLSGGRVARVIFFIKDGEMVLVHGFVKKTQKTASKDLALASKRKKEYEKNA